MGITAMAQPSLPARSGSFAKNKSAAKSATDTIPQPEPYAWRNTMPLGERYRVPIDTLPLNFYQADIPNAYSLSYSTTGNLGSPGFNNIYFDRPEADLFFFKESVHHWLRGPSNFEWYNTRIPYTQIT